MTKLAGYSGTPLVRKLGIKDGMRISFVAAPPELPALLGPLPGVSVLKQPGRDMDLVHGFVGTARALRQSLPAWRDAIRKSGMVWVSWPKKSSGVQSDLDGNVVRQAGLDAGLVDVKVCAVSDVWSGLKFVWRIEDRL